jgi:hypothetical protein
MKTTLTPKSLATCGQTFALALGILSASFPGRLQFVSEANASPVILSGCLTTSSSMVLDQTSDRLVIAELATGRLVTLQLP